MDEVDKIDSSENVPDEFSNLNEDFFNTHKELQDCFSRLKLGYITEKELRKQQQKALENIKNIYEEVFGENSFRPLQTYSVHQMQELSNEMQGDKNRGTFIDETSVFKVGETSVCNEFSNFVKLAHSESTRSEHCINSSRIISSVNGSCNKCKAMHLEFVPYFGENTSSINTKCTNISKGTFCDRCKSYINPAKALYFDENSSFMNNNRNEREFEKLKLYAESLDDENHDISDAISKELSKLYNLKDTIRQLEEYDRQMSKKINDVLKVKENTHMPKVKKSPSIRRKKVTIPQPFNLSQVNKCSKSKDVEPVENKETFHATPIPNHVYEPLYERLTKKEERKRTERKVESIKKLKANAKPCNLTSYKFQKYKGDFQSVPDLRDITVVNTNFKAKPIPCFVYNNNLAEKIKEEEKRRHIRIKQRSETLLKQSALPFSRRKVTLAQNLSKSLDDLSKKPGNKQRLNNKLYDTFKRKTTTVCQPFHFRTEERHLDKIKNLKTVYENQYISCTACNTPKKVPVQIRERPTSAPFSYVNKRTHSSALRDHYVRQQLHLKQEEMEQELQKFGQKLQRENCFFNMYGWKFKLLDSTEDVKKAIHAKLKSNRKMALQRQNEYKTELKEMKKRVHERPLLIEMQAAMAQKERLEKCYQLALERAGVNTEFVEELSGRCKDRNNYKPYDASGEESCNSDTSSSEQGSEIDNNQHSLDASDTGDESNQNLQHSSRTTDDYAEHSSNLDLTSQCSQQSVISNKEPAHSSSESTNTVP